MFFIDQPESGRFVNLSCRDEDIVRPELDLLVFAESGELDALVNECSAESEAARRWLNEEEAQLGDQIGFANEKNASNSLSLALGYPAPFADRVELLRKLRRYFRDEIPESGIPAVFVGVNLAVSSHDPIEIVVSRLSKCERLSVHACKLCNLNADR
jgi:hypothetical protein